MWYWTVVIQLQLTTTHIYDLIFGIAGRRSNIGWGKLVRPIEHLFFKLNLCSALSVRPIY